MTTSSTYRALGKRVLDLAISIPAILLLLPFCALIALLIRVTLGSPVFFRQRRPGRHGRPFTMLKFRTMTDARDVRGDLLPDEQRMTRLGRLLRRTSVDELPELLNVLRGDMSLVGPRPLLMRYLPYFTPEENRRHDVLPGLTGWAQVNGRNHLAWDQRFAHDVWYVEHCCLLLDLRILLMTIFKVLRRDDEAFPECQLAFDEERQQELERRPHSCVSQTSKDSSR